MSEQVVQPRIRGFLCLNAHPEGCRAEVARQIEVARASSDERPGGNLLVIGGSTGYGLASRITGAFGYGMDSIGVFYERPPSGRRTASAGWYNSVAFTEAARAAGLEARNVNGDAFSAEVLDDVLGQVEEMGGLDLLIYSLAAPARTDPATGVTYRSALRTIGEPMVTKSVDIGTGRITEAVVEPATDEEIEGTIKVMGGEDLRRWVDALLARGLLRDGARVVAYTYLGPEVTWPFYRHGTIGMAKEHLESTCAALDARLRDEVGGRCWSSVNKSMVTQAAAAIPAVPLYISLLYRVMQEKGVHEDAIAQIVRLFSEHIGPGVSPRVDDEGRIRIDDLEMSDDVQTAVAALWETVTDESLAEVADLEGYRRTFKQLFGFEVEGVDYDAPVEVDLPMP